jgi:hypothetical protein
MPAQDRLGPDQEAVPAGSGSPRLLGGEAAVALRRADRGGRGGAGLACRRPPTPPAATEPAATADGHPPPLPPRVWAGDPAAVRYAGRENAWRLPSPSARCTSACWFATSGAACASTRPTSGLTRPAPAATRDGTVIIRSADDFDLALHPGDPPEQLPGLPALRVPAPRRRAVRELLARMQAGGVQVEERWDEPS